MSGESAHPDRVRRALAATFLVALTAAIYGQVGDFDFIGLDDLTAISGNPVVNRGFSVDAVVAALFSFQSGDWMPLTWMSLMADVTLFGLQQAGPMHSVNAVLHAANGLLVLLALHRMTGSLWRSAAVAAIFVAHPLCVESVAWVIERKDVLSTLFFLLALDAYVRFARRRSLPCLVAATLGMAASLMCKPMLVTFPALLLLVDYWPLGRWRAAPVSSTEGVAARFRGLLLEKVPFLLLATAFSVLLIAARHEVGALYSLQEFSLAARLEQAVATPVVFLQRFFWPVGLRLGPPLGLQEISWGSVGAAILVVTITAVVFLSRQTRSPAATGWFWYMVTLVPVSGLVTFGKLGFWNRFMYVPHIGLGILVVWTAADAVRRSEKLKRTLALCPVLAVLALATLSRRQVGLWRDDSTLFGDAVRRFPDDSWSRQLLGEHFQRQSQQDRAIEQFEKILARRPGDATALWSLGVSLGTSGRIADAVVYFERALEVDPANPDAHFNLAVALKSLGRVDVAERHYRQALLAQPDDVKSRFNLALLLIETGRSGEARDHFAEVARLAPRMQAARDYLDQLPAAPAPPPNGSRSMRDSTR